MKILKVMADVRYWEDATINGVEDECGNLTPCRKGDSWCPEIDIQSGKINNWPQGTKADIHFKVCDMGVYTFIDKNGVEVKKIDGYVPGIMCPEGSGYGDYIIMKIDENGFIANWQPKDYSKEDK